MGHSLFKHRAEQDFNASEFAATVVSVPYFEPVSVPAPDSAVPDVFTDFGSDSGIDATAVSADDFARPTLQSIGRYALKQQLGQGGLGTVFEAWDPLLSRMVAVKTLQFDIDTPSRVSLDALFLNEARAAAGLNHSHIVTVHDAGLSAHGVYIAMERLRGRDLRQALQSGWQPSPAEAALLVRRVADALAYAHARGVVHCDIKPANIFLRAATAPRCWISALPAWRTMRRCRRSTAWWPGRRTTRHRSSCRAPMWMPAPTSTRSARCCTSCSRGARPSMATRSSRSAMRWRCTIRRRRTSIAPRCRWCCRQSRCVPWRATPTSASPAPWTWRRRCASGWPASRCPRAPASRACRQTAAPRTRSRRDLPTPRRKRRIGIAAAVLAAIVLPAAWFIGSGPATTGVKAPTPAVAAQERAITAPSMALAPPSATETPIRPGR